jgi:hypothetical protein
MAVLPASCAEKNVYASSVYRSHLSSAAYPTSGGLLVSFAATVFNLELHDVRPKSGKGLGK